MPNKSKIGGVMVNMPRWFVMELPNTLALTTCLYRDPIQSYGRKRITLLQSVVRAAVRAAVRDIGDRLTATIAAHGDDFEWYRNMS